MKFTVLVADDEGSILQTITDCLTGANQGYSVIVAPNGEKACELAVKKLPDIILLDWMMPGQSGIESLQYLKSQEKTKEIPVLMVTGLTSSDNLKEAFDFGAVDYIHKPIDKIELLARVKSALLLSRSYKEIKKQNVEIEKQNHQLEKLSLVASKTINGVIIAGADGEIEWLNDGYTRMFGYTLSEYKEKFGNNLVKGTLNPDFKALLQNCISKKKPVIYEGLIYKKDETKLWISSTITPILDNNKDIKNIVVIDTDITDRVTAEDALNKYFEELERSNRELNEFASIASHDLQSPLRKIIVYVQRLTNSIAANINENEKEYLKNMQNTALRMQLLIENLLHYSKINTIPAKFEKVNIKSVVEEVISDLEIVIKENDGSVEVADLPVIMADKQQMYQLFQNMVSNAVKYHRISESPVVKIGSRLLKNNLYEITIEDNGIGFDEKYLDRIFKPFQRLHNNQAYVGTGLGTAICYKIVKRHNGNITAKSMVGKGSTFIITLPENSKSRISVTDDFS